MICFPHAKINLGLSVIEKRPDNMHNIETCYVPVPLFDVLEFYPSHKFSLKLYGLPLQGKPEDNLIARAWDLITSVRRDIIPVEVHLYKAIPPGSGLGGGSSDAAFFLKALNTTFSLGFSVSDLELLAAEIGADCPFFIKNQANIATGTGNIFSTIGNPIPGMCITIVFPEILVSTKAAYTKIIPVKKTNLTKVLRGRKSNWKNNLKNDFEKIIFMDFPEIEEIKNLLYNSGALYASLTGSGSAVYALSAKPIDTAAFRGKYKIWTGFVS